MDIQRDNFFPGRLYQDSFMHGKPRDRPREYPKLENKQRLNLPPMPHSRFNKIPDRTHYRNDMQFGDGSDWATFPVMKLTNMGWVCDYDGVAMYGNCGNHASLNITDAISVEAWVKPIDSGGGGYSRVMDKGSNILLWMGGVGVEKIIFTIYVGTVRYDANPPIKSVLYNNWHYVVGSYNSQNLLICVDGIETIGDIVSGSIDAHSAANLIIGNKSDQTRTFNGVIDLTIKTLVESAAKQKDDYWRQA